MTTSTPETIKRSDYLGLIATLGFKAADLREVRFAWEGAHATVYERDLSGAKYIGPDGAIATREVFIPVVQDEVTR